MTHASGMTHVFDLDGVVLASNGLKEAAFRRAAAAFGPGAEEAIVRVHREAGGVSRREQVERFLRELLAADAAPTVVEEVLDAIAAALEGAYDDVPYVRGARAYLAHLAARGETVALVSGVEEVELLEILQRRGLRGAFGVVSGGPPSKAERLRARVESGAIALPAVYYGDTEDDYRAATAAGMDFVHVTADARRSVEEWAAPPAGGMEQVADFRALLGGLPVDAWRAIARGLGVPAAPNAGSKIIARAVLAAESRGAVTAAPIATPTPPAAAAEALTPAAAEALTPSLSRNRERGSESVSERGRQFERVRVDRKGFAQIDGERRFLGRSVAGALVTIERGRPR